MTNKTALAGLLLVGLGTAACGGNSGSGAGPTGSGAPTTATVAAFCQTLKDVGSSSKVSEAVAPLKQTGTPSDMPADARKGFDFIILNAAKIDSQGGQLGDKTTFEKTFGKDAATQVVAFFSYATQTCMAARPGSPASGAPTMPSAPSSS